MNGPTDSTILVCPETKLPLREMTLEEACRIVAAGEPLISREAGRSRPCGPTATVMVRSDGRCAYPIVKGIPVLLVPEMLTARDKIRQFSLSDPKYAEAYTEMAFYNSEAEKRAGDVDASDLAKIVDRVGNASERERAAFPEPLWVWLDSEFESVAQLEAYEYLRPVTDERVLQLGGSGSRAVKFLLGGASEAWLLTPMLEEAVFTERLARRYGVADRFRCVTALAEEMPFADGSMGRIYSGGCVHHMVTSLAMPECARVLRLGGKFSAVEPWRAPFYSLGTRVFGKQEANVFCRPLSAERVSPLAEVFRSVSVNQHGTFTRYPLVALSKLGLHLGLRTVHSVMRMDDRLASLAPQLRKLGSVVFLGGTR